MEAESHDPCLAHRRIKRPQQIARLDFLIDAPRSQMLLDIVRVYLALRISVICKRPLTSPNSSLITSVRISPALIVEIFSVICCRSSFVVFGDFALPEVVASEEVTRAFLI